MSPRPANPPAFHIITGGPGSKKTTLIDALALEGFHYMPEAGRAIIRDQVAIEGTALPWSDRAAFAELMLAWNCAPGMKRMLVQTR